MTVPGPPTGPTLIRSFADALRARCRYIPTATVHDLSGLTAAFSNLALRWNFCLMESPPETPDDFRERVTRALAHGRARGVPWCLVLPAEWVDDALPQDPRLKPASDLLGCWADALVAPGRLPTLHFSRATTVESLAPFATINNRSYGLEDGPADTLYRGYALAANASAIIGREGGVPVTCAGALPLSSEIYVGGVATLPEQRRRGFGEAVLRHAIADARTRTPLSRVILFAVQGIVGMYERMGFTVGARLRTFYPA